jgi:putative RNA 2'-phosphotransferase
MKKRHVQVSKFLSYVLRHKPDAIGLELDAGGWATVEDLIRCSAANGQTLTRALIEEVVATNDKQRFSLSPDGDRIRANQGHSVLVDLGLKPVEPPRLLYHGTATRFLASILENGLRPSGRQHVHLSPDEETALKVGKRHGKPVVLTIEAGSMHADGHPFYRSDNDVWLTEEVPSGYLRVLNQGRSG